MIKSFADRAAKLIFEGRFVRGLPEDVQQRARRKLHILASAGDLRDLAIPPGNQLEALQGRLAGLYSIRINRQWRLCFRWEGGHAHDVAVIDYH